MTPPSITLVVPGRLDTRTGGYIYDRRIAEGLRRLGWRVDLLELGVSFPCPTPADREDASRALASLPGGTLLLIDGLALGGMPDLIARERPRLTIVALVHLPLAAAVGLERGLAARLEEAERQALAGAALVVVTGRAALPLLARYDVPSNRVAIVAPGTDRPQAAAAPRRRTERDGSRPVELLCVGTVSAGKGHDMLLDALAPLRAGKWRLTCAGSTTRDPVAAERVRAHVLRSQMEDRVSFAGDLDESALARSYAGADVFVLATRQETYGMAVAEALSHGLPVVATKTGAIEDLVGGDAGLLVPVGDTAALRDALARVIRDDGLRARLAAAARQRGSRLPTWDGAAARMAFTLRPLLTTRAHAHG